MTLQQELEYYKKALADYTESLGSDEKTKAILNTDWSLCIYFKETHHITDIEELEALFSQRPKIHELDVYWFPIGAIEPRLQLLLRAIDIVEQKIKEENGKDTI